MAYIPPLNGGRLNASLSGNSTSAGAGYSLLSTGTMFLAGGNNITLSQNGASVTISGANAAGASINISASNASANLASVTFSNSNGVSFGLNAGVITASHNGITSQSNPGVSAGGASYSFQTLLFSNTNGVSFSTSVSNGSSAVVGSVATTYAASNHSHGNPTLNLTNISGTTASASNGLTLSLSAAAPGAGVALSAAGNSVSNGTVTLSNSNGLAFGMAGSVITGSYTVPTQSNQSLSIALTGNTGGNTSGASFDARNITIQGLGNVTAGFSTSAGGTSLMISGSQSAQTQSNIQALYDGANTVATGSVSLGNVNGVTLGLNGQTLTASHNGITSQSNQLMTLQANTTNTIAGYSTSGTVNASALNLRGTGNVSVGYSNGSVFISGAGGGGGGGSISAGGTNYTNGLSISASGALTMSTAAGSTLTMIVPAVSQLTYTGAVSMSSNGSTVSIGAPIMSMGITGSTAGGATGGNTVAANNALYLAAGSNITLSQSTGVGGATVSIYGTSGGGGGSPNFSAGTTSNNLGSVVFSNSNGVGFGLNGSTITGANTLTFSAGSQSTLTASGTMNMSAFKLNGVGGVSVGFSNSSGFVSAPATSSLVGVGAISISTNGSTISVSGSVYTSPRWEFPNQVFTTIGAPVSNSLSLQHIYIPYSLSARSARIAASISAGSLTTTGSGTVNLSLNLALYTLNGSTLSQLTSGSTLNSYQITASSTAGVSNILNGIREISAPLSANMTPGDYWIGALLNTAQTGSGLTVSMMGNNQLMTGAGSIGIIGSSAGAGAHDMLFGQGLVATAALPSSVALSAVNNTSASNVFRAAFYHAIYSTVY